MNNADQAAQELRNHFSTVSTEDYLEVASRYSPELLAGGEMSEDPQFAQLGLQGLETEDASGALALFRSAPAHTPLDAYLACALTGLDESQRQLIFALSDMVAQVCESIDIQLYEPRKKTDPVHHTDVPDSEVFKIDRERVLRSDLLIYLAHFPSTGAGEELDFAYNSLVPMVVVSHANSRVSRMVSGIPGLVVSVTYAEPEEFRARLREELTALRPLLVQRKLAFGDYDVNIVGDRIRRLRERQGLTRDDLATATVGRVPLSSEMLKQIEESTDRHGNPSLVQLREIATALKTTVADLVEPDLEAHILSTLGEWVSDRRAAREGLMSTHDRNRLLRRLLLRILDSLETDE